MGLEKEIRVQAPSNREKYCHIDLVCHLTSKTGKLLHLEVLLKYKTFPL